MRTRFGVALTALALILFTASLPAASLAAEVIFTEATTSHGLTATAPSGVAIGDYDRDGDLDVFVAESSAPSHFFVNTNHGHFSDQSTSRGLGLADLGESGRGIIWNFDNDGDSDLFAIGGTSYHMVNEGNGTHVNDALLAGLSVTGSTNSAIPFDYNRDGRLDLYLGRGGWDHSAANILYRNLDSIHFADVAAACGLDGSTYGGGALIADYDNDGDSDLYIIQNGVKYICRNNGNGTFTRLNGTGAEFSGVGNSGAAEDFDRDGDIDIFLLHDAQTNFGDSVPPKYLRNNLIPTGHLTFSDSTALAGITNLPDNGTDVTAGDVDNDGDLDLYVAVHEYAGTWQDHLYLNDGHAVFTDVTASAGLVDGSWRNSGGCSLADLDTDGDLDLLISRGSLVLLENRTVGAGHWLAVELRGTSSNRAGIGARVALDSGLRSGLPVQVRDLQSAKPSGIQDGSWLHFGLGTYNGPVVVTVHWPYGSGNRFERFKVSGLDRRVVLIEGHGSPTAAQQWTDYQ